MLNRTEILAPAGNFDAVRAAVNAHADAVYLGGNLFSARAFAGNFNEKELLETIDYCHTFDVKVYMAVNTLLKNEEIKRLPDYVEPYYREGVDGIIVQDMGVANVFSENFPDLPLHGSTQLSVSSEYGAAFLKNIGMTRFVPSRELSLDEIRSIKSKIDIEIETFVHGAMCYCYSGRCLMSSYAGGRSGNRGRCAQPCRKKYQMGDEYAYMLSLKDMCMLSDVGKLIDAGIDSFKIEGRMKKPEYVAATTYAYRELRDAYLSGCSDLTNLSVRYENMLRDIYNRGGFCSGYYFAGNGRQMLADKRPNHTGVKIGKVTKINKPFVEIKLSSDVHSGDVFEIRGRQGEVEITCGVDAIADKCISVKGKSFQLISVGNQVYRTRNNRLLNDIQKNIIDNDRKINLRAELTAKIGEKMMLKLSSLGEDICENLVIGPECVSAANKPVTEEQMLSKIKKTGGTPFEIEEVIADVDDGLFVPIGAINNMRRQALEEMRKLLIDRNRRTLTDIASDEKEETCVVSQDAQDRFVTDNIVEKNWRSGLTVAVSTSDHVNIVKNYKWVSNIIVDYNIRQYGAELKSLGFSTFVALPEVLRQKKLNDHDDIRNMICTFDGVVIKNIDELGFVVGINYEGPVIADAGLYVYNDKAYDLYSNCLRNMIFMSSQELTLDEINGLSVDPILKIYGYQKVMITAGCVAGNYRNGCAQKQTRQSGDIQNILKMTDDMGNTFYVRNYCSDCYNVIYNGVPTSILDRLDVLPDKKDGYYIEFTVEDSATVRNIMDYVGENIIGQSVLDKESHANSLIKDYTRGHYFRGID